MVPLVACPECQQVGGGVGGRARGGGGCLSDSAQVCQCVPYDRTRLWNLETWVVHQTPSCPTWGAVRGFGLAYQVLAARVLAAITVLLTATVSLRVPWTLLLIMVELAALRRAVVAVALWNMVFTFQLRVKLQEESAVRGVIKLLSD
eukprot:SAG11_NODE_1287_length_5299_cov_7.428654_2_plen_147_part_00